MYWLVATRLTAFQESLRVGGGESNEDPLIASAKHGDEEVLPSLSSLDNLERFFVAVYGERKKSENIETLAQLRFPKLLFQISICCSAFTTNDECIEIENILQPFRLYGFKTYSSP